MKIAFFALSALLISFAAQAQTQVIRISGPAAEDIAKLLGGDETANITCQKKLVPSAGGEVKTVCSLRVSTKTSNAPSSLQFGSGDDSPQQMQ